MPRPELSLVIPIQDQEASLQQLDERLRTLLTTLANDTEVLFVEDGSTDRSLEILRRLAGNEPRYRVLSLSRRFGYEPALAAGMDKARGQAVIVLDPEVADIGEVASALIAKWHEGYDVVYGQRRARFGESTFNVQINKLFDWIFSAITPVDVPRGTGNVRLVNRRVVTTMRGLHETHRFVRGLVAWVGFKQTFIEYDAAEPSNRTATLFQRLSTAIDVITSFSAMPLRLAATIATFASFFSFLLAFLALVSHGASTPPGWTSIIVLGSIIAGLTFLILGILGAYVARLYEQAKRRPLYIVSERINFKPQKEQKLSTSDFAEVAAPLAAPGFPPVPLVTVPLSAAPIPAPTPPVPPVRPLPSTPPPSYAPPSIRPRTPSSATLPSQPPPAPSAPPPRVAPTPSVPAVKAATVPRTTQPVMTPSAPPVSKAPSSLARPSVTMPSVPPAPKVPTIPPGTLTPSAPSVKTASIAPASVAPKSIPPKSMSAPPAPKPGQLKETQRSGPAKVPAVSDPKKLFGGDAAPVEQKHESIKPPPVRATPSVMPKPIEEDDDKTLIQSPSDGKTEN